MGLARLKQKPSEYLKTNAHWGFFEDRIGMKLRHEIGVERIMWSTDFPHIVTRWPNSLKTLQEQMSGVSDGEQRKMVAQNAIDFFHLDQSEK
jgi:predicted TIM-barrel fold metal-dependent hydrolase